MHVKVNLRVAEAGKTTRKRGIIYESYKIGHKAPITLERLLINTCRVIAVFWMELGCGSLEEGNAQLHKAAERLATMEWREESDEAKSEAVRHG